MNKVERADDWVPIRRVLASVSDKSGLDMLIPGLMEINPQIHFYSTGGTYRAIAEILGPHYARHVTRVSDYTGQPETQGGLVKTLDFKIYLGLLTETHNPAHQRDLKRTRAVPFDLVVVNLYPFESTTTRQDATMEEARANIDVGGVCMIRAAAKNYLRVTVVVDPADYGPLVASLRPQGGRTDLAKRFELAQRAFRLTAAYDQAISAFISEQNPSAVASLYRLE